MRGTAGRQTAHRTQSPSPPLAFHRLRRRNLGQLRPNLVGMRWSLAPHPACCHHVTARTPLAKVQALFSIKSLHSLVVHGPAFPSEQYMNAPVAVAKPDRRDLFHPLARSCLVVTDWSVAMRRTIKAHRRTAAAFAHPVAVLEPQNDPAPSSRPQTFFASTSCSIDLSRLRSATNRFSLRFSSSS